MLLGILTFLSALTISAVAIYYSVAGLAAIFAAAVIPIIIMGVSLEVGKLVTAVWLHRHWSRATWWLKTYLAIAVFVLMFITSMGIFGFLSKAHLDQVKPVSGNNIKIELIDNQIAQEQKIIDRSQKTLDLLDKGLEVYIDKEYVTRGLKERKKQEEERNALNEAINNASDKIAELTNKKATLSLEQDKIEAEVGPIKYIAELIYGENAKDNFDKAVRGVILVLIFVFDPLAVLLLIAANISLAGWISKREDIKKRKNRKEDLQLKRDEKKLAESIKQNKNYKEFFKKFAKKNLTNEDYEKFFTLLGDKEIRAMGLDPDEIRIKMDQILDWNASSVKEMSAEDVETDKTLVKSKLDKNEGK